MSNKKGVRHGKGTGTGDETKGGRKTRTREGNWNRTWNGIEGTHKMTLKIVMK